MFAVFLSCLFEILISYRQVIQNELKLGGKIKMEILKRNKAITLIALV